jgi:hypothetical protein
MSTQVQFRRGTTTQNNAFTGAAGELSVDTDLKTIRLHDGTTAGGGATMLNNISNQTALNKTFSTGSSWQGSAVGLGYGGTGSSLTAAAGAVPYSTSNGLALNAPGTSGQVLVSGGTGAPTWVAASSIAAGTSTLATTATNIAGGSAGQLVIQSDTSLSTFITAGASGTFLRSAGAGYAPTWATADVTIGSTVIDLGSSTSSLAGLDILTATGTSHWKLPVGTSLQRPGSPATGMVRYNTTISSFEGYSSGAWSSLGGVTSVDKLTYILAETSAGASNGELEFYVEDSAGTGSVKALGITHEGIVVAGNLTVNGTTTTLNSTTYEIDDPLIYIGAGNVGNSADIGIVGHFNPGTYQHTGLVRDASDGVWKLFSGVTTEPTTTIDFSAAVYDPIKVGTVYTSSLDDAIRTQQTFSATTSGTSATAVYSFAASSYRSGKVALQIANGSAYRILEVFVIHDGTNATISENYTRDADIQTGATNTTITADISGGNVRILATAASGTSTVKGEATIFKV